MADPAARPPADGLKAFAIEVAPVAEDPAIVGGLAEPLPDPTLLDTFDLWALPVLASTASGILLATVGMYVVMARAAFVSAAVSQLAGLGVVLAMLAGATAHAPDEGRLTVRLAGLGLGILGTGRFALPRWLRRTSVDAMLAIAVIAASAFTLVGARYLTQAYQHVKDALYGDAVVATASEVVLVATVAAGVVWLERACRYRFVLALFDPETANAQGMPVRRWSYLLGLLICSSVALTTAGIGALPAFAFSVVAPTTALLLTSRLGLAFRLAALIAALCAVVGYFVSFVGNLPVGPTMSALLLVPLALAGGRALTRS